MALSLPAAFARSASWASNTASAEPTGRGRVKRLPALRMGSCMAQTKQKHPPPTMEGGEVHRQPYCRRPPPRPKPGPAIAFDRRGRLLQWLAMTSFHALIPCAGTGRAERVFNGLRAMLAAGIDPQDWVLVHDAARCLVQPEDVGRLVHVCMGDAVGGLLALPLPDTLKSE